MYGALLAIVLAFPVAALMALVFRFPIPLCGYASGISAVIPAMVAVVFYGTITGGFLLLGVLGALVGTIVSSCGKNSCPSSFWRSTVLACLAVDALALFVLAMWDKVMGPW